MSSQGAGQSAAAESAVIRPRYIRSAGSAINRSRHSSLASCEDRERRPRLAADYDCTRRRRRTVCSETRDSRTPRTRMDCGRQLEPARRLRSAQSPPTFAFVRATVRMLAALAAVLAVSLALAGSASGYGAILSEGPAAGLLLWGQEDAAVEDAQLGAFGVFDNDRGRCPWLFYRGKLLGQREPHPRGCGWGPIFLRDVLLFSDGSEKAQSVYVTALTITEDVRARRSRRVRGASVHVERARVTLTGLRRHLAGAARAGQLGADEHARVRSTIGRAAALDGEAARQLRRAGADVRSRTRRVRVARRKLAHALRLKRRVFRLLIQGNRWRAPAS